MGSAQSILEEERSGRPSPLHLAAGKGEVDKLRQLIAKGANVNETTLFGVRRSVCV